MTAPSQNGGPVVNRHKSFYSVPRWCRMHPMEHFDGMGGCWGIHYGLVDRDGRDYCKRCAFYRRNAERVDPWTFESQVARNAVAKMEAEESRI